jgi:hypothetical protein
MSLLSSRRRPWPYHARMGSILGASTDRLGFMLLPNDQGLLVGRKQQMLDAVVPSVQEYGSAPVYRERTFPLHPVGGYGERVQSGYGDKRYYWGQDIQLDGGLFGKGPLTHQIVPTSTAGGGVAKLLDVPIDAFTRTQLILAGTKVYRRTDDSNLGQVVLKDFTPNAAYDAVVFQGGFSGAAQSTYVTTNGGALWERTPGNVWTVCLLPAGFAAYRLEVVGGELWAADVVNSIVRKVTSDPKVAANWSGPFFIGNPSSRISALRQTNNQLTIFKEDGGVFTLNSDGSANDLFAGLRGPIDANNGANAAAWLGALWFRSGPSFYRLDVPSNQLTPTGPGKLLDNASPVRGDVRTFCGWGGYRAYLTLYNPTTATSYLMTYGNWEPHLSEEGTSFTFDDQFDGSLAHWPNRTATAMAISSVTGQDRLYVGFSDGGWDWIKLVRSPLAADSGAEFVTGPSEITFPLHHAMFEADLKHWLGFSCFGPVMRPGDEVALYYRIMASAGSPPTDPTGDWLYLGEFVKNGQRIDAPPNLVGNALSLKASLSNTNQTDTPVIEIIAYHERVVPAFKRDVSMTIDGRAFQTRLDGAAVRYNADDVHKAMMNFAAAPGSIAIELPDETVNEVAIFGYGERMAPMAAGGGRSWAMDIQATQFRILTLYGIIRRLRGTRIGDLRGYKISALRAM